MRRKFVHPAGRGRFVAHWVMVNILIVLAVGVGSAVLFGIIIGGGAPAAIATWGSLALVAVAWPLAQFYVIRDHLPALSRAAWIVPSAGVAFGLSAVGQIMRLAGMVTPGGLAGFGYEVALGVASGAAVGAAQAHVLRRHVAGTHVWIAAAAAGRGVSSACWFLAERHGLSRWTLLGLAGMCADLILTGYVLAYLLRPTPAASLN